MYIYISRAKIVSCVFVRDPQDSIGLLINYVKINVLETCLIITWLDSLGLSIHLLPLVYELI